MHPTSGKTSSDQMTTPYNRILEHVRSHLSVLRQISRSLFSTFSLSVVLSGKIFIDSIKCFKNYFLSWEKTCLWEGLPRTALCSRGDHINLSTFPLYQVRHFYGWIVFKQFSLLQFSRALCRVSVFNYIRAI